MKLYHFAPLHLLRSIKGEGLTRGVLPIQIEGKLAFIKNVQWLTSNKSWNQSWNYNSTLPYSRTAARITIEVDNHDPLLIPWMTFRIPFISFMFTDFDNPDYCDRENWYVYDGKLPREYLRKIKYNKSY